MRDTIGGGLGEIDGGKSLFLAERARIAVRGWRLPALERAVGVFVYLRAVPVAVPSNPHLAFVHLLSLSLSLPPHTLRKFSHSSHDARLTRMA